MSDMVFIGGKPAFALDRIIVVMPELRAGEVQHLSMGYEDVCSGQVKAVHVPFLAVCLASGDCLVMGMN